jgi:CRISPR-associated protein (Cas_Cmr3)
VATALSGGGAPGRFVDLRGPLLVSPEPHPVLWFPVPHDVVDDEGTITRLHSEQPGVPGLYGDGEPARGWLPADWLADYLRTGPAIGHSSGGEQPAMASPHVETRLGIARDRATRTVSEGMLYTVDHLRMPSSSPDTPGREMRLAARVTLRPDQRIEPALVRLGGRRRRVELRPCAPPAGWPTVTTGFHDGQLLVYLATPALFTAGTSWTPPGAQALAVACRGPQPVATKAINSGRGTALRWAVPAGTVFFCRFPSPEDAQQWAQAHNGTCLTGQPDDLRTAGFGLAFTGRWT